MLPFASFEVRLVPGQTEDVDEEALCQAVASDDAHRLFRAGIGQGDASPGPIEVAVRDEARLDDLDAFLG